MNAIDLLKEDHDVVSRLFDQVRSTPESKHRALFKKIKAELDTHAHIEETVFYPRLKKEGNKELVATTLEGIEEHRQVKMFLKEMDGMRGAKGEFEAKLQVLMEDVEHHVKEEENEMFPDVEDQFSDAALERLGRSLENKKQKYLSANPEVAKNIVRRPAAKVAALGAMVDKAVAAVGEMFTGSKARSASKKTANGKSNGKAKDASGDTRSGTNGKATAAKKPAKTRSTATSSSRSTQKRSAGSRARG